MQRRHSLSGGARPLDNNSAGNSKKVSERAVDQTGAVGLSRSCCSFHEPFLPVNATLTHVTYLCR